MEIPPNLLCGVGLREIHPLPGVERSLVWIAVVDSPHQALGRILPLGTEPETLPPTKLKPRPLEGEVAILPFPHISLWREKHSKTSPLDR